MFALAAITGNSTAALRLAEMHDNGNGIPVNADKAALYYVISAEPGNTEAIAPATAAKKLMAFRVARQIPFNNRVNAWFSEHGHTRVPWD